MPVEDMAAPPEIALTDQAGDPQANRSIWPAMYPRLLELVRAHRTTLVFVNYRRLAERLALRLNELAGEEVARAHHGSLAREARAEIEEQLKAGTLRCLVATSSLELGIDMGAIDLVVQVESPRSVSRGLQRVGRAGPHRRRGRAAAASSPSSAATSSSAPSSSTACSRASSSRRASRATRSTCWPSRSSRCARSRSGRSTTWRRSSGAPTRTASCRAPSSRACSTCWRAATRPTSSPSCGPRIVWDRVANVLHGRPNARPLAVANAGTIPDRGLYGVFLADGTGRVGELDEEMVYEARVGQTFLLGASSWRIERITRDRVLVSPAPGQPGQIPFWRGEGVGPPGGARPRGRRVRARDLGACPRRRALERLRDRHELDDAGRREPAALPAPTSAPPPACCRPTAPSSSSASATRSATGACASSARSAARCTRRGRWRSSARLRDRARRRDPGPVVGRRHHPAPARRRRPAAGRRRRARPRRRRGPDRPRAGRLRAVRRALPRERRPRAADPAPPAGPAHAALAAAAEGAVAAGRRPRASAPSRSCSRRTARCLQDVLDVPGLVELLRAAAAPRGRAGRGRDAVRLAVRLLAAVRLRRAVHVRGRRAAARAPRPGAVARPRACCASCSARRSSRDLLDPDAQAEVVERDPPRRTAAGPRRWPTCCGGSATCAPEEIDDPEAIGASSSARAAPSACASPARSA